MKVYLLLLWMTLLSISVKSQDFENSMFTGWDCGEFAIADFNNDGYSDIFGIDYFYQKPDDIYLYTNKKTPVLEFTRTTVLQDIEINGIVSSDYDKDGDIDVIYSTNSSYELGVFVNDGAAQFTTKTLGVSGISNIKTIDLENDGDIDLIGFDFEKKRLILFLNNGSQTYTKKEILSNSKNIESIDVGDFDGDNDADIVVGFMEFSGEQVILLKNDGLNTFAKTVVQSNSFFSLSKVAFHDLNLDNKIDIIASNSSSLKAWLNEGTPNFKEKQLVTNGFQDAANFDIADFNGDKLLDIVVSTYFNGGTFWFENTSNTNLTFDKRTVTTVSPSQLEAVDLDKDGDQDILANNGKLWWFINNIPQIPSSTIELDNKATITLYPNPLSNSDYFSIKGINESSYRIVILDINGRTVLKQTSANNKYDIKSLKSGLYIVKVFNPENKYLGSTTLRIN